MDDSSDRLSSAHDVAGADMDAEDDEDLEVEDFRRALSLPVSKDELRRTLSTPAEGRKARHQAYAVPAKMAEHFGQRATFTSSENWLGADEVGPNSRRNWQKTRGSEEIFRQGAVEPFSITELESEPELEPEDSKLRQLREENEALKEEMVTTIEELYALRRQVREEE